MKTASEEESPKFCIFAAGAIGGMIATLLARSGATVSVVARGQAIPTRRVLGCVLYIAASVDEPGIIRHSSGRQLLVGEGGISAFAVILPKRTGHGLGGGYPDASHVNGCYAETLDRKTGSNFGSLWAIPPYPRWVQFSMKLG